MKTFYRSLVGLALPVNCLECDTEGDWICPDCLRHLMMSRTDRCCLCGKAAKDGLCQQHRQQTHLDGLISLFDYRLSSIQKLIKVIKYQGLTDGINFFVTKFGRPIERRLPRSDWVFVPIPLEKHRFIERGFNQAELLAKAISDRRFPVVNLLNRVRATQPQVGLLRKDRVKNVRNCFAWSKRSSCPKEVVLFDDVVTTGSTFKEAARILRRQGAREIWAITIAHG